MLKFTFEVDGREMTLFEDELKAFARAKLVIQDAVEGCNTPTEGKAFAINPMAIDRSLFSKKRKDEWQERTRQRILDAFTEVDANPEKYAKPFKTMIMKKTWKGSKTFIELIEMANTVGRLTDWVEQALEWAQRIMNGEAWARICNKLDMNDWCRLVTWKDGNFWIVGGSRIYNYCPASDVYVAKVGLSIYYTCDNTVPLVTIR